MHAQKNGAVCGAVVRATRLALYTHSTVKSTILYLFLFHSHPAPGTRTPLNQPHSNSNTRQVHRRPTNLNQPGSQSLWLARPTPEGCIQPPGPTSASRHPGDVHEAEASGWLCTPLRVLLAPRAWSASCTLAPLRRRSVVDVRGGHWGGG